MELDELSLSTQIILWFYGFPIQVVRKELAFHSRRCNGNISIACKTLQGSKDVSEGSLFLKVILMAGIV